MVLDATLHYKVMIKGKMGAIQEMEWRPFIHFGIVAIEKGAFGSPSTMVANFTFIANTNNSRLFQVLLSNTTNSIQY